MTSETFEQVLTAAQTDGSFTPAWKKFVKTKFFVPVLHGADSDPKKFTLLLAPGAQDGIPALHISEVRERIEHLGAHLASLSGAEVVRLLHVEAAILVALSDRAFGIAKERVDWLKQGIAAAQARAAAAAAAVPAPAPAPIATPKAPAPLPAAVPAPVGMVDVGALKPRNVALPKVGLDFYVPHDWREIDDAKGLRFTDDASATTVVASGFHRPDVSLPQWQAMRMALVRHEMRYLTQAGEPYALVGDGWNQRISGMATEFTGIFPGDDVTSRYLVACVRIDGTVASLAIRAPAAAFERNRALYQWLLGRVNLAAGAALAPAAAGAAAAPAPGLFGLSVDGRIGRLRALAYAFPATLPFALIALLGTLFAPKSFVTGVALTIAGVATMCLCVRLIVLRLHDVGLSGKWVLGFLALIVLAAILHQPLFIAVAAGAFWLAAMGLCCVPGTYDDNAHGAAPGADPTLVKVGAGLFIALQLAAAAGQAWFANAQAAKAAIPVPEVKITAPAYLYSALWNSPDNVLTVAFPTQPKEIEVPKVVRDSFGYTGMQQFKAMAAGRTFMVQVIDFGKPPADPARALEMLERSLVVRDGELLSEDRSLQFNGHPGREVHVRLPYEMRRAARLVLVGSRMYAVMTLTKNDPESTRHVDQFLNSLTLKPGQAR